MFKKTQSASGKRRFSLPSAAAAAAAAQIKAQDKSEGTSEPARERAAYSLDAD